MKLLSIFWKVQAKPQQQPATLSKKKNIRVLFKVIYIFFAQILLLSTTACKNLY